MLPLFPQLGESRQHNNIAPAGGAGDGVFEVKVARRRLMPAALYVLLSVLAAGRASAANECVLSKGSDDGLAIISGTLPPVDRHLGSFAGIAFAYNHQGGVWLTDKMIGVDRTVFFEKIKSDFTDVFGKLIVLRLPAGNYEFKYWTVKFGMGTRQPMHIQPLTFTVEAGRAVYLGSFDTVVTQGETILHQTIDDPWVFVRDRHARDLPVFATKCPGFDPGLIDLKVMDTARWLPGQR